jgi:DNA replication protein DnaC
VLLGPVGTGKTHAAIAAARMRFDCGSEVRFLPIIELLDMLRPGGPDGALEALMSCELLIVDDLGLQRATDWTDERLDALLNRRWLEQLSTIVTTNLTPDTLLATVGERSYSRLRDGSVGITIAGEDRRKDHHA